MEIEYGRFIDQGSFVRVDDEGNCINKNRKRGKLAWDFGAELENMQKHTYIKGRLRKSSVYITNHAKFDHIILFSVFNSRQCRLICFTLRV